MLGDKRLRRIAALIFKNVGPYDPTTPIDNRLWDDCNPIGAATAQRDTSRRALLSVLSHPNLFRGRPNRISSYMRRTGAVPPTSRLGGYQLLSRLAREESLALGRTMDLASVLVITTSRRDRLGRSREGLMDLGTTLQGILNSLRACRQTFPSFHTHTRDSLLVVTTDPIILQHGDSPDLDFGRFDIRFAYGPSKDYIDTRFSVVPHEADYPDNPDGGAGLHCPGHPDFTHPHIRGSHGTLCTGDAGAAITMALKRGDFLFPFLTYIQLLATYNNVAPYVQLSQWWDDSQMEVECPNCNAMCLPSELVRLAPMGTPWPEAVRRYTEGSGSALRLPACQHCTVPHGLLPARMWEEEAVFSGRAGHYYHRRECVRILRGTDDWIPHGQVIPADRTVYDEPIAVQQGVRLPDGMYCLLADVAQFGQQHGMSASDFPSVSADGVLRHPTEGIDPMPSGLQSDLNVLTALQRSFRVEGRQAAGRQPSDPMNLRGLIPGTPPYPIPPDMRRAFSPPAPITGEEPTVIRTPRTEETTNDQPD